VRVYFLSRPATSLRLAVVLALGLTLHSVHSALAQPRDAVADGDFTLQFKAQTPKRVGGTTIWMTPELDAVKTVDFNDVALKMVKVKRGDTFSSILVQAKLKNDLATYSAIRDLNPQLKDVQTLEPEQEIKLPDVVGIYNDEHLGLPATAKFAAAAVVYDPGLTARTKQSIDGFKSAYALYAAASNAKRFPGSLEGRIDGALKSAQQLYEQDVPLSQADRLSLKENTDLLKAVLHQKQTGVGAFSVRSLDGLADVASQGITWTFDIFGDNSSDPLDVIVKTVPKAAQAGIAKIDGLIVCVGPAQPYKEAMKTNTPFKPTCDEPLSNLPSSPVNGQLKPNVYVFWARYEKRRVSCFKLLTVSKAKAAELKKLSIVSDFTPDEIKATCDGEG